MRGLFRAFEREGVEYLLIGGQAAILYGAAQFTQDLDVWVAPTTANLRRLLAALARLDARVYKLTPPVTVSWARRGHGFHFTLPQRGATPAFLDVMGRPPRVASFGPALRRAERMKTPWGDLAVVSIEDLVELKKTNRPGDYEVIARLVRTRLSREKTPTAPLLVWAVTNTLRVEDLQALVDQSGQGLPPATRRDAAVRPLLSATRKGPSDRDRCVASSARVLDARFTRLLDAGRRYWIPRVRELQLLRSEGGLLPLGLPVVQLAAR